jgi:hypothetical protein
MRIINQSKAIDIPLSVFDIKVSDYIDYQKCLERYEAQREAESESESESSADLKEKIYNSEATIIECVSYLCKGDLLHDIPFSTNENENTIYTQNTTFEQLSQSGLFEHLQNIIAGYEIDERAYIEGRYSFEYKGVVFCIENITKTGNVLETLELQRLTDDKMKQGDATGTYAFSKLIRMCAVLCRKKGERLPFNIAERARFIEERANLFQDITLNVTTDLDFFLRANIIKYLQTQDTSFSFKDYQKTQT